MAQDHPRRDDIIGEMGEGNALPTVIAGCDVAVHAYIITGLRGRVKKFLGFLLDSKGAWPSTERRTRGKKSES